MNPAVDFFFKKPTRWQREYEKLRHIIVECGLTEELKWGCPCYTFQQNNIVLMHGFKEYCALLFMKGALLSDTNNILIQQTKNVQAARQIRFKSLKEIEELQAVIKRYVYEAIEVVKQGLKVSMKTTDDFDIPEEFRLKLNAMPALKEAFEALTAGRQRAYKLYFSAPKQSKTREARVKKQIENILNGKGLNDV